MIEDGESTLKSWILEYKWRVQPIKQGDSFDQFTGIQGDECLATRVAFGSRQFFSRLGKTTQVEEEVVAIAEILG